MRSILLMTTMGCSPSPSALRSDESSLRHGAIEGINQQQHAIDHAQDAFDLTTEVGVAGRIDDVDLVVFPVD